MDREPSASQANLPGHIGRYQVQAELGRGGMGVVYLALDPEMDRQVALKVLALQLLDDNIARERLRREARLVASLEHDAIVPIYDVGEIDRQFYLVLRYMPGGTLVERLGGGRLTPQRAGRIIERIAPALDYAYARGVVHRDLKPGNILFDREERAYLSDFGIAWAPLASDESVQERLTGEAIPGTAAYMSPEQILGRAGLDGRSDQYALGVVAFEMLTGQLPFLADSATALGLLHVGAPAPDLCQLEPGLPLALGEVVKRALAKDPDERFNTMQVFAMAFEAALKLGGGGQSGKPAPTEEKILPSSAGRASLANPTPKGSEQSAPQEMCAVCGYELTGIYGNCPQCGSHRRLPRMKE